LGINQNVLKGVEMEQMWLVFFWSGPIGLGIGLVLVGVFILLLAKANEINKRTKALEKEKGLEKKSVLRSALRSSQE
jgi:hypothetical protein